MSKTSSKNLVNVGDACAGNVNDIPAIALAINGGTFVGANIVFEASLDSTNGIDGNWQVVSAARSNSATVETSSGVLNAAPGYAWEISVNAYKWFRARLTAITSGSVPVAFVTTKDAVDPTPTVQGAVTATPPLTGASSISVVSAASTNPNSHKASAGSLMELAVSNPTATPASVKLYNKASAPTVGTDVPVLTITLAAGADKEIEFGAYGKRFTLGIASAITALPAATDVGVAVAGVQVHGTYV